MIYKHAVMLIALSVAAIFFQDQLMHILQFLMYVHAQLAKGLGVIFSLNEVGETVQSVLALLLIPVVLAILFAVAHFFIRQQHFPHTMTVIWVCWAVMLASVLSQTGRVTNHPTGNCKTVAAPPIGQNVKGQDAKDLKNAPTSKEVKEATVAVPQNMQNPQGSQNPALTK